MLPKPGPTSRATWISGLTDQFSLNQHVRRRFCCRHACLRDARLLAAGGTERYDPFVGLSQAVVVDPAVGRWVPEPHMGQGRWYSTLVALPDGDVLAVSGLGPDGFLSLIPER